MAMVPDDDLTGLLGRIRGGDAGAEQQLVTILYQDLRAIAARRMRRERPDHTWQPTVLVHEALLRLRADGSLAAAADKTFLLRAASRAMHRLLIEHHRRRRAAKHGGQRRRLSLDIALDHLAGAEALPLISLSEELDQLAQVDERACMVVHFRFFLGMAASEVAEALGVSQKTVERDWIFARGWLHDRLKPTEVP